VSRPASLNARDPHQANHVLRAFRYQLLQSLQAWLDLRNDEELWLELNEDFSVISSDRSDDVQVKHSETISGPSSVTLRTPGVRDAILRYWARSAGGTSLRHHVTYLARSGAGREQGVALPENEPALLYWQIASGQGHTGALRDLLIDVFKATPLSDWLETSPPDEELRARLLGRIRFSLSAKDDAALERMLREQLGAMYLAKGHYASTAEQGFPLLFNRVFTTASQPAESDRRLSVVDLHYCLEEALPRLGALRQMSAGGPTIPSSYAVTPLSHRADTIHRHATIEAIRDSAMKTPLLWIRGGNGTGKSTLAALLGRARGGSWIVCDFRPYAGDAQGRGALAAWSELVSSLTQGAPPAGIILDDLSARSADLLKQRIAGLTEAAVARGAQVIVTSNHTPSGALLSDLSVDQHAVIEAPYFSTDDVEELVRRAPSPPSDLIAAWAKLIHVATSSGHPLLTVAKIAHLRQRNWPNSALLEDLGHSKSTAMIDARQEARVRLLAELPSPQARELLERVSTVFMSFEDALVYRLCGAEPAVAYAGDSLALLKGSWIEPAASGGWRLSPLITDLQSEVAPESASVWRRIAAEHWLAKRTLNEHTLPLCFWNAFLGKHIWVLLKLGEVILGLPPEQLRGAAAMLSPMAALSTDVSLLPEEPMTAASLRLLQIRVAEATDDQALATRAALAWLRETDSIKGELHDLQVILGAYYVLEVDQVRLPSTVQFACLSLLRRAANRAVGSADKRIGESIQRLTSVLVPGVDLPGMLFTKLLMRVRRSEELEEMINTLATLEADERVRLLASAGAVLDGVGVLVHNAWAKEQLAGKDLHASLIRYDRMSKLVGTWGIPEVEIEFEIARSVLSDEGIDEKDRAIAIVDSAIKRFGPQASLIRQKSKILGHLGDNESAARLLLDAEEELNQLNPFDRMLALREGAIACANISRFEDSSRLFAKARAILAEPAHQPLRTGLLVEQALVAWRQGNRQAALTHLGDAFEELENIDSQSTHQGQRTHKFACAMGGYFMHEVLEAFPVPPHPSIKFGQPSALESDRVPQTVKLPSLAENWRLLELVEILAQTDARIAARAESRKEETCLPTIESQIANARFAAAVSRLDIPGAIASITPAVSMLRAAARILAEGRKRLQPIDRTELSEASPDELRAQGWELALQGAMADILLFHELTNAWRGDSEDIFRKAVETHFGDESICEPLIAASKRNTCDANAPWPILACSLFSFLRGEEDIMPANRYMRDLYLVHHVANSLSRHVLEPLIVERLVTGWTRVLEEQRFALTTPRVFVGEIAAAIQSIREIGLRGTPALFLAAAPAVSVTLTQEWDAFLLKLQGPISLTP
jgi:tetratricopeptide (TPR) repeat protein